MHAIISKEGLLWKGKSIFMEWQNDFYGRVQVGKQKKLII